MKRLNIKLLVILVIAVVVLSTGVAVVHAIQMNRNSDSLLKRAEAAKSSGDTAQAIFYYRRYLSYKQQDLERFAEYALLSASVAESPNATAQEYGIALKELQSVLLNDRSRRTDPLSDKSRADVRRKLIDLEMGTRQIQLVAAAKTLLLEMKAKGETSPKDDLKLATCQVALTNYLDAVKIFESLIGYNPTAKAFDEAKATLPQEVDAYITLANILREKITDAEMSDRTEVADRVVEQLVKMNKDSAKAFLGQARYLQQYHSRAKAKPAVDKALALAPNDADILLQAAEMSSQAKDFATAEKLLKKGIEQHPQDDRMYFALAALAKLQNNREVAKERLEAGLKAVPTSPMLLQLLCDQQLEQADAKSARVTLQKLSASKNYPSIYKEFREAQLLILEGNALEASRRLEKLRPQLSKIAENTGNLHYVSQTDYMLMQSYQRLGFYDLALTTARRLAVETQSLEAEVGIGGALMALGKTAEAKSQFEKILAYLTTSKQLAAVPQIANALMQLRINEQTALPEDSRDWDSVIKYIADLRQQGLVKEPTASLMQADVLARKGDKTESRKVLDRLAQEFPDDALVRNARVEIALQERKFDEASQLINSAPAQHYDLQMDLARIEVILLRDSKKSDKIAELEALNANMEKQKATDIEKAQLHLALGMAYRRLGDADRTAREINQAADLQPRDALTRWRLYDLFRETGDTAGLKNLRDWFAKELGIESAQAKLVDAAVLVSSVREDVRGRATGKQQTVELSDANRRELQKSRDLLRTVEALRPDWFERPRLLSEIDLLEGKPDEAIIDLREALRQGPPDPAQVRRLSQLLLMQKRYSEVQEVLNTYGKANKGLERIEAVNEQLSGRPDLALQRLETLIPKDSTNASDHLYYGQLLASTGKSEQAETEIRRAVELAPQQPETWLGLVNFLMSTGRGEDARKAVQESQIQLPEDRRTLAIAQGYELLGDRQLADQFYKAALDAQPDDPKIQRLVAAYYLRTKQVGLAKPLVTSLLSLKPSNAAEREALRWARRSQAQMLATQEDYQSFLKAMEYLSPLPGESPSAADLSMQAFLLGARSDVASAQQALKALEELKNLRALSTEERLLLSQVYERTGNWGAARDELLALLNQPNANLTTYSMFIEMLLRRNAADSALPWLQKLEAFSRANPLLVATVAAHVAQVQGNGPQAVARMMRLLPTERPLPKDKVESLRMIADLLGQLEQYDQAEKLWREYIGYAPEKSLELASFLAKRGKVDEALQLAEQRRKSDPAVLVLQVANAAAKQRIHPLTPEQVERISQWFQRAMRDDPESVHVQLLWADFLDSQGRYDEVEKVYQAVLARGELSPKNRALVSNNLAFAMAIQGHQLDEALKLSDDTIAYLGPIPEALDTRGVIQLAKGNSKQAVRDLTDAVSVLDPTPSTFVHLAMAQAAAKDAYSARKSLERAKELKLDPGELTPLDRKKYEALKEQLSKPS